MVRAFELTPLCLNEMKIIRDLTELTSPPPGAVVTIGNFDGIHLGHREIFRKVIRMAAEIRGTSVVFTFVPHPLKVLNPAKAPPLISTYEEKERLIEASCVDMLVCCPFTRSLAAMSAEEFVRDILVGKLGIRRLIVGYDYAFGKGREGDVSFLRRKGDEFGFGVEVLEPILRNDEVYSSTRIREMIREGLVSDVVNHLGRHFNLQGTVVHGAGRGGPLGFPTANLQTDKEILPKNGVYAVKIRRGEEILDGVANIGVNPTFGVGKLSFEVHIFDFNEKIYKENLRVYFMERLRDEKTFAGPEELIEAIRQDAGQARKILKDRRIMEYREYLDCG